jgi:O-succinylhomoserine sulfhydrylase
VEVVLVDGEDLDQWRDEAKKGVKLALIETPANPTLGAVDKRARAEIVHGAGGLRIVVNTSWSIPPPSIWTARDARWAAPSSRRRR